MHTSKLNRPRLLALMSVPAFLLTVALVCLGALATPHHHSSGHRHAPAPAVQGTAEAVDTEGLHLALGAPTPRREGDVLLVHRGYVVAYDPQHEGPAWAAWRLTRSDFGGAARHAGHFLSDETLPAGLYRVTHGDYTGSGFDRGHLVRSEDRTSSDAANAETFLLTNVLPQRHDLNAGPWLRLEDQCRSLAEHDGRVLYIVAGPIYDAHPRTIGHGVAVPSAFWKVVVVLAPGQGAADVTPDTRVIAVTMPNVEGILSAPWTRYETTLGAVERHSGFQLLGRLSAAVHAALEGRG